MILGVAIANITRNLDIFSKKDGQGVSSHAKLKEEGLTCLKALVEEAPASEYLKFLDAEDHAILLAYTLNVLCQISKNDKSKSIRTQSLEVMLSLMNRLEIIHETNKSSRKCSIQPIVSALPGVSSTLFRLIMSDTKLPRSLLIVAIRNLSKLICLTFISCQHKPSQEKPSEEEANKLKDICDNLAIRLNFLIDYATSNALELPAEMQYEVLDLCHCIMRECNHQLLICATESIVKYLAFVSADGPLSKTEEIKLKIMLMTDCMKDQVQNSDDSQKLDSVIISGIIKVLDNLETHAFSVLIKDRQSELAILLGFLRLLPDESLTLFLELEDRRNQLINMLIRLSEFSTNQPFLLLTERKVMGDAIEISNSKICSVEKRFTHLKGDEIQLVSEICHIIGFSTEWPSLNDIITNDLRRFSDSSNLYITNLILKGCLARKDLNGNSIARFTAHMLRYYIDSTEEECMRTNGTIDQGSSKKTLTIVIAIETIATLVDIHLKFVDNKAKRIIVLKDILCPLLKWASSSSRAVSEAALSNLTQISQLYEYDSVKSLIEANIDYVVDGVMHMLENFSHNCDVTNVLAVTFKLSSKSSFYYFKDVFGRIFRVLAIYQNTEKAQSILLLFYRTLGTLIGWREATSSVRPRSPLENEATLKSIIHGLAIDQRIDYLAKKPNEFLKPVEIDHEERAEGEAKIIEDAIKSGKTPDFMREKERSELENEEPDEKKKEKPNEIVLTEKILDHCASMISSDYPETKILALKTAALGFEILRSDEDTLLPLVHKLWKPLSNRLVGDYGQNLEVSLCAFECLISMAENSRDFIKSRTLDSIIPRVCIFLESQARESLGKKDYGPYGMTVAYKCQLKILTHLGSLAYHIELAYSNLWRVVRTTLLYLNTSQMESLREAAKISLHYMMALDADCVWYYSKQSNFLHDLPFHLVYEQFC